jgi:hypothetical protein
MKEATIAGDEFRLVLRVSGYERPTLESGADANWLVAEAELLAESSGTFRARRAVALRTEELEAFHRELAQVVERFEGEVTLRHMEDEVGCTIRLRHGRGEFDGFVRSHVGPELRLSGMPTDQSFLQQAVRELAASCASFPSRAIPWLDVMWLPVQPRRRSCTTTC